jgi:surface antigen/regulator of replication initiation timing
VNTTIDLLATASRFAIAAAIIYFAYQLAQINDNVPVITQSVEQVSQHIEPTLEEVKQVRLEIAQVRKLIPEILDEVAEIRKQVPVVVAEMAEVRKQFPAILTRVESINQQVGPILQRVDKTLVVVDDAQRQIPQILSTADNAIAAINDTNKEIKLTRESIDPTLDRVDGLVEDAYSKAQNAISSAEEAGTKASEGAVSGFFTGLIKLPFKFIGSLASPIVNSLDANVARKLTEKDIELLAEAGTKAIKSKNMGKDLSWENPKSGNSGSITTISSFALQGFDCVEARVRISHNGKQIEDDLEKFCLNENNEWVDAEDLEI